MIKYAAFTYPDVEFDIFVGDGLDVETDGRDGVHRLAQLQLVEDGGLSGRVQAEHQDPHLLVAEHLGHYLPHLESLGSHF